MRVGEAAERAGVNVETLRYYERRGLLPEPQRGLGGHREYDDETVRLLVAIKEAQAVGFTLKEIGEVMKAARRGAAPEALRVRMATKLDEIDGRIASLRHMREELARVVGCNCDSLDHCTCGAAFLARGGRASDAPNALLHVTNGDSAGNTLRLAGLGGAVLPWRDTLHEGPVPLLPRRELLSVRAAFLSDCGFGDHRAIRASLERRDAALREAGRVVLWFEHDLYDQLQLLDVLSLVEEPPELIVVDTFLGTLREDELAALWPQRVPATEPMLATARRAWDAFRAPDPVPLAELTATPELPFLRPAVDRLLAELPAPGDGLSATERLALEAVAAGAPTPLAAFFAVQQREEAPFLGDTWFFRTLASLDGLVAGDPLRLTPDGERVLAREADRVELIGVDRWLGGTHVTRERLWRYDRERGELLGPADGRPEQGRLA